MLRWFRTAFWALVRLILSFRYRVRVHGRKQLRGLKGPVVVFPNHPAYIDPALVLSRQDLTEFWQLLRDDRPTAPHRLMTAWRAEALGQPLLDLVAGLGEYTLAWSDGRLRVG